MELDLLTDEELITRFNFLQKEIDAMTGNEDDFFHVCCLHDAVKGEIHDLRGW